MELCNDVCLGLSLLRDDSRVSKYQLTQILDSVKQSMQSKNHQVKLDIGDHKLIALAIACLFIEAAKINRGLQEEMSLIKLTLQEAGVDSTFGNLILDNYKTIERILKDKLLTMKLDNNGMSFVKTLVDVDWRQDLVIKSKYRQQLNESNFLIDLKTQDNGETISFAADLPGLQDLIYQLRNCCKVVETTLNTTL